MTSGVQRLVSTLLAEAFRNAETSLVSALQTESLRHVGHCAVILALSLSKVGKGRTTTPYGKNHVVFAQGGREDRRQHRVDRYNEVVGLHRQGMSQQAISLTLHIQRKTIRRFVRAARYPERATGNRAPAQPLCTSLPPGMACGKFPTRSYFWRISRFHIRL